MQHVKTLSQLLSFQAEKFINKSALNFKKNEKWHSFSNQDFLHNAFHFACGLKELGFEKGQTLAIASYQNPIWLIADFGALLAGAITVPIFHNISQENLLYELKDAQASFLFTDEEALLEIAKEEQLKLQIITHAVNDKNTTSFEELIALGKKAAQANKYSIDACIENCKPEDLATIIYTSGSTGTPKGVALTHANLISQITSTAQLFPLSQEDKALSFLPLAHIFERMVMMFYISQGISVYFAGDVKDVGNLLKELSPTLMTAVPRVLEKVYGRIKDKVDETKGFKGCLAKKAVQQALGKHPESSKTIAEKIYDAIIYKKFRESLGGKMEMIICGGAALSNDMERFYKNIGINLFCGYGLTEASPVLAVNYPNNSKFGTIGKAFPAVELKISNDGELLATGPNIMKGYHNQAEQTAQTMEGKWLKTGDLATIDEEGFITITGRKKELFKNANGKYVSPVPIEQKIIQNLSFLLGATIIAEGRKFTSALLFPDFDILCHYKEKLAFLGSDEAFLESQILKDFVDGHITTINQGLDNWEKIQKFAIIPTQISIETGEITPSMKLKRHVLETKFMDIINHFYA